MLSTISDGNFNENKWNQTWRGDNIDECRTIALDSSDNIYIAGIISNFDKFFQMGQNQSHY